MCYDEEYYCAWIPQSLNQKEYALIRIQDSEYRALGAAVDLCKFKKMCNSRVKTTKLKFTHQNPLSLQKMEKIITRIEKERTIEKIIFCYSGRSFNIPDSPFPQIPLADSNWISAESLLEYFKDFHIIIFLDCSNTPITRFAVDKDIAPLSEAEIPVMDKIFEFKGKSIIACCQKGECSFGDAENGSIFSSVFLTHLARTQNWERAFADTATDLASVKFTWEIGDPPKVLSQRGVHPFKYGEISQ